MESNQAYYIKQNNDGIPSQVFFNHIHAIYFHIYNNSKRYDLKSLSFFNNLKLNVEDFNYEKCKKMLWNSWSTEYTLSMSKLVDDREYYKFALHWCFPQVYYSIFLSLTAFHLTQGITNNNHEKTIKQFGNHIEHSHYPNSISFYAKGLFKDFNYHGLDSFSDFPEGFTGLERIQNLNNAHIQIAKVLKTTRRINAEQKRILAESNNEKCFFTKKNKFRKKFNKEHWDILFRRNPQTTLLNIIYRLRIKANYHDIDTFINAEINYKDFNHYLCSIVGYLNFIHEAYLIKCIGKQLYENIINSYDKNLIAETAVYRYNNYILQNV